MLTIGSEASDACSLYIHVPFCSVKCPYCHFYVIPYEEEREKLFVQGIAEEWHRFAAPQIDGRPLVSIYFGGGTPSLLNPSSVEKILRLFPYSSDCEITLEANPESVTPEKMRALKAIGINRLSIGVQSLDDGQLHVLDRRHRSSLAIQAIEDSAAAGFDNLSIDLMYDIPGQSLASWHRTIDRAMTLPISHLSLYNLTFEPNTIFFKKRRDLRPSLPSPEESSQMLEYAVSSCEASGLRRYEISAFARGDAYSRHNTGYWTGRPFLGLGPSAFSYFYGKRFKNAASITKWLTALETGISPVDFEEKLSPEAAFRELLAIRIRLLEGIDLNSFTARYGSLPSDLSFDTLIHDGLLSLENNRLRLTSRGLLFYDTVAAELI